MRRKALIVTLIVSLSISAGLNMCFLGVAAYGIWRIKMGGQPPMQLAKHILHLNEEQMDTMTVIGKESFMKMESIQEELDARKKELLNLIKEPELDTVRQEELFAEIATLQTQLDRQVFKGIYRVKKMLTPEQQERFFDLLEEKMFEDKGKPF